MEKLLRIFKPNNLNLLFNLALLTVSLWQCYCSRIKNGNINADVSAASGIMKMKATQMESLVNVAASRAEKLKRNTDSDAQTDKQLINSIEKIVSDTVHYLNQAQQSYSEAKDELTAIKKIPQEAVQTVINNEFKALNDRKTILDKERAKSSAIDVGNVKTGSDSESDGGIKNTVSAYANQKREAEILRRMHEENATENMESSENSHHKAMAIIGAANSVSESGSDINNTDAMDLYSEAAKTLEESRDFFVRAGKEQSRAGKIGKIISKYDQAIGTTSGGR